jgi:hypothetical protein
MNVNVTRNIPDDDAKDANTVLTRSIEEFYEHFMGPSYSVNPCLKSELMEGLKFCIGVTSRDILVVKTRQGVRKMTNADLKHYLGAYKVEYMNDEPVVEGLLDLMMDAKRRKLVLVKI